MSRTLSAIALILAGLPVAAQDSGGLSYSGEVKLEYTADSFNNYYTLFAGDVALAWRSGGLLGFDASVDTINVRNLDNSTNYWAAAVLAFGSGELAIGAPRPVLSTMGGRRDFGTSRLINIEQVFEAGQFSDFLGIVEPGMTPGITYSHNLDSVTFAVGYHRKDGDFFDEADIYQGLIQYDGGATQYFISAERAIFPVLAVTLLSIGARYDADRFSVGATFSTYRFGTNAEANIRLYGSYEILPGLSLAADYLKGEDSSRSYALSAKYKMDSGLFVEGGFTHMNPTSEAVDIGVGFSF